MDDGVDHEARVDGRRARVDYLSFVVEMSVSLRLFNVSWTRVDTLTRTLRAHTMITSELLRHDI